MPRQTAAQKQAETRARLVSAATESFLERGFLAASLDEISERAGYSTGAVYHNFKGKEGLFAACLGRLQEERSKMWEDFIATASELGTAPDSFGKILLTVLPSPQWNRALIEFRIAALSEESREALEAGHQRFRDIMVRVLPIYCQTVGVKPPPDLESIADSAVATVDGLRFHALTYPDVDIAGTFQRTLDLLLGVPPRARRSRRTTRPR